MANLSKHDIASIGLKLLSIYIALRAIASAIGWLTSLAMLSGEGAAAGISFPFVYKLFAILLPFGLLLIPILLWVFSEKIARFIAIPEATTNTTDTGKQDIQAILFCVVGLFIFITTLPELVAGLYHYIRASMMTIRTASLFQPFRSPDAAVFISLLLKCILSLALIFKANHLSLFMHKLRYAGMKE